MMVLLKHGSTANFVVQTRLALELGTLVLVLLLVFGVVNRHFNVALVVGLQHHVAFTQQRLCM